MWVRNLLARHACSRPRHDPSELPSTFRSMVMPLPAHVLTFVLRERVGAQVLQHGSGAGERRVRRERAPALQADAR